MKYIELKGTPREIGRQHGSAFREDIQRWYDFYARRRGKTPEHFPPGIRAYTESRLPEVVEEIRGLAEGAGLSYAEMLAYNHFSSLAAVQGCTPVFFRDSDHGPLLGQTLDCPREELEALLVRRVNPDGGRAFLGCSFVGTVWPGNWVNDAGLGAAGVSAHHAPYRTDDGTCMGLVSRDQAGRAASVDEAFDRMKAHHLIRKIGVHLYADSAGSAALVEGEGEAGRRWKQNIDAPFAFSTGLFFSGRVKAQDEPDYIRPKVARKATVEALYAEGRIEFTLEGMKRFLAHHAPDPGSICRHNTDAGFTTQSGRILILREGKLLLTCGRPCEAPYEEFELA